MKQIRLNLYIEFLVVAGLVVVCGLAAYQRNLIWKDDLSIWSDVVEKSPEKFRGHNNLGNAYAGTRPQSMHNGVKNARNERPLSLS